VSGSCHAIEADLATQTDEKNRSVPFVCERAVEADVATQADEGNRSVPFVSLLGEYEAATRNFAESVGDLRQAREALDFWARSYCFKTISFLTEVTPATARATFVAVLMSSLEFTKPLN
jgi:hypothetical protein